MVGALEAAHNAIREIVKTIDALAKANNKKKLTVSKREIGHDFYREVEAKVIGPLTDAMRLRDKLENYRRVEEVLNELVASLPEGELQQKADAKAIFKELKEKVLRDEILEHRQRLDGRKFDEIRDITIEVGVLPRVHGSTVFTRGETQALVTATLGTAEDQQKIEMVDGESYKRFMLHYNFPPFSVGEVSFLRGPGRREIGHGALAERALLPVIPSRREVAVHDARRLRHPGVERIVLDGLGLRRHAGADGRGRAALVSGRRHGDGPRDGRDQRQIRRAVRHRGR